MAQTTRVKQKRYCIDCGAIYEVPTTANTVRCIPCAIKHNRLVRRDKKRIRDRKKKLERDYKSRFSSSSFVLIHDPEGTLKRGSLFRGIDVRMDLRFGNFVPGTIIRDRKLGCAYIVKNGSGKQQTIEECISFSLKRVRLCTKKQPTVARHRRKKIVIIYETGYNIVNSIL